MTGDLKNLITPPVNYWSGRVALVDERGHETRQTSEHDTAWDELVAWFAEHGEWCDLIQCLEGVPR